MADLPAVATVITDPGERRRVFTDFVESFNARQGPDSPWPNAVLEEWVGGSPLARVDFADSASSARPVRTHDLPISHDH